MYNVGLGKAENQRSNCQHPLDHWKSERVPEKHLFLLYWLCQSLWLCGSQQTGKFWKRWEYQTTLPASWEIFVRIQFSSVTQSCPTLCDPKNWSTPVLPVHHHLPEITQTHIHRVCDAIQPSHPLLFPSPPAPNPSQHQSLFQWVNSLHQMAKVVEFQL